MKRKITRQNKLKEITRVDEKTFYVPSSDPDREPYMVFNSVNIGWTCDCLSFVFNMSDAGHDHDKECKHIKQIKQRYNLV